VKFLSIWVDDATQSFEETTKRGAKPLITRGSHPPPKKNWFLELLSSSPHIRLDAHLANVQKNKPWDGRVLKL